MQARTIMLAAVIGGPLAGMLLGIAANPTMVPPPEPSWHSARPDPIYGKQPQQIVDYGPQDLSPNWFVDRTPTWKRRAAEREAAAYARLQYADYMPERSAEPETAPPDPAPASPVKIVTWPARIPMAEAAADTAPDRDAKAGAEPETQPALVDAAPALAL